MTINQLQKLWETEKSAYQNQEVGSGVYIGNLIQLYEINIH